MYTKIISLKCGSMDNEVFMYGGTKGLGVIGPSIFDVVVLIWS